jgi:hypothetical protein
MRAVLAAACGRPIELVDEGALTLSVELPFDAALPEELRVTAEVPGLIAETALALQDDGTLAASLPYVTEAAGDHELIVRAQGEGVLLARHTSTVALLPREDVELAVREFATSTSRGPVAGISSSSPTATRSP